MPQGTLPQTTKHTKQKLPKPSPKAIKSDAPGGPYQKQRKPLGKNNQNKQKR
jgi:hypothetical protein